MLPYTKVGVIGGIMLGLGRALGETMAVTLRHRQRATASAPRSSSRATRIASALANEFNEAADPVHRASLISLGLVLFVLTFIVLALLALLHRAARQGRGRSDLRRRADGRSTNSRIYRRRLRVNRFNLLMSLAAMAFGMASCCGSSPCFSRKGLAAISAVAVHRR